MNSFFSKHMYKSIFSLFHHLMIHISLFHHHKRYCFMGVSIKKDFNGGILFFLLKFEFPHPLNKHQTFLYHIFIT